MLSYIIRRLLLIIPTLWAIITINFFVVQIAPGGPVEQMVAEMRGIRTNVRLERLSGITADEVTSAEQEEDSSSVYRGARGLDPEIIEEIKKRFGFDRPLHVRYFDMLKRYAMFDFGESLFRGGTVIGLIGKRLPVSISLGIWSTLFIYLISIPLGITKAVKHGSRFDMATSTVVTVGYAIPSFLFAILLIVLFAGGSYLKIFPLRGLVSVNFEELSLLGKIADYFWHLALPITALTIGGYATLTMLTKNSVQQAVRHDGPCKRLDRAKNAFRPCLSQRHAADHRRISRRLYQHVFHGQRTYRSDVFFGGIGLARF